MCKLFAVVEIENERNAELFTKQAIPTITKDDDHGLGIMRLGERGVHIRRWLDPTGVNEQSGSLVLSRYADALKHQENSAGTVSRKLYAIAVHGRFATCVRSLENTHPFFKDGSALMHNGVIPNADKFSRTLSTCDSEALLSQYLEHKVKSDPNNLTKALNGVGGYYAAIVFNDNGTIDIWRDDTATLFMGHVRGVGIVVATTREIITKTARKCKARVLGIDEILPNIGIRWMRGVNPKIYKFEPKKPALTYISTVSDNDKKWWELEKYDEREKARVADWQAQEEQDDKALKHLQGITKGI